MGVLAAGILTLLVLLFIFWPQPAVAAVRRRTRLEYVQERRDVVYDNLRDLNFEYRAGKHPEADFLRQREELEAEAASLLAEGEALEAAQASTRPAVNGRV